MTMMREKMCWVFLATLVLAAQANAQSQVETAFEIGVGYGSPAIASAAAGGIAAGTDDMVTLLIQGDDYLFETGIGINFGGNTVFGWMIRGAARPFLVGNVLVHTGAEFSLHTNSVLEFTGTSTKFNTLTSLGFLVGVSHQITDRINGSLHVFPLAFTFGGTDTITTLGTARLGAHLLF